MDAQTLKLDVLSNDLDCYTNVMAAMESSAVFDMGIIRGQYADLHHRYVTMQPTHFKRTAISAGMENGFVTGAAVVGAAVLLGILIKISKWIADAFFGGSANGGAGGGGGGAPIKALEKTIKDGDLLDRINDVCAALEKGKPVKVDAEDTKGVNGRKAYVLSGKKPELLKDLVDKMLAVNKESAKFDHKAANVVNLFRANANKPDANIKDNPEFKEYLTIQDEQIAKWEIPATSTSVLKQFYETTSNVSCAGETISAMSMNLSKAAKLLLSKDMLPLLAYVIVLNEGIDKDKKRIAEIEGKGKNTTPVEQAELAYVKKATRISQKFFQSVYELYKFASESLKESATWLADHAVKNKDAYTESELSDIKEKLAELKKVNILLLVHDN